MNCSICLSTAAISVKCNSCMFTSCSACVDANDGKCCSCSVYIDECSREVDRQISLLYQTRRSLASASAKSDNFKQCPGCGILIEKEPEDCDQMFCIVCKTVWSWDTLEVVIDDDLIHNPLFFGSVTNYIPPPQYPSNIKRSLSKCMKALNNEPARYAADTFTNRLMYITDQISFDEFKNRVIERYEIYLRNSKLKKLIEDHNFSEIPEINPSYCVRDTGVKLPYV